MFREAILERRCKPRIDGPIPARVQCMDSNGTAYETETVLDNLSVSGLHVRLECRPELSASVSALMRFAGMTIEATGVVKRVETQPDGTCGLGVAFNSYRIL